MNWSEYYQYAKELAMSQLKEDVKINSKQEASIYASQFARETIKSVIRNRKTVNDLPQDETMKKIQDRINAFVSMLKPIKLK